MDDDPPNIIDLAAYRPHLSGRARCMHCKHEWQAVAPVGTILTCPSCDLSQGAFIGATLPPDGHLIWRCDCDNIFFVLRPDRIQCAHCGVTVQGWP